MSAEREWRHEWKERPIEQLRDVLSMLCNYIWTKQLRPGEHLWSIPVDQERDFDCILHDAVNELEERRKAAGGTDAPPPAPSFICNCGTTMVCPDIGCDKNKVAADAPPLAEPDLAGDLAAWKDWQAAGKPRADAPPPAPQDPDRLAWLSYHVDHGHGIAKREQYDECSCGATYWRKEPAADAPPPGAPLTHSLELKFGRVLTQDEWRTIAEAAHALPYVRELVAHAEPGTGADALPALRALVESVEALDPAASDDKPYGHWDAAYWRVFNAAVRFVKESALGLRPRSPRAEDK